MFTVYIFKSEKDGELYIGQTGNFGKRLRDHFEGRVKSTKNRRPLKLIHIEHFQTRSDAILRERELKNIKMRDFKRKLRERVSG